jgi:hypothetical protein
MPSWRGAGFWHGTRLWRARTWRSGAACHRVALVSRCGLLLHLDSGGYWANRAAELRWWPDPTRSKPSAIPAEQDDKTTSDTVQIADFVRSFAP